MKAVKIILIIICIFSVVFFATGLVVKETSYTVSVAIEKPVSEVFTTFNNIENTKNWIPEIESVAVVKQNIAKAGSIYEIVINRNDEKITVNEKILAFVPNEKVTMTYNSGNMLKTNDYVFTTKNNKTTITLHAVCRSNSYMLACVFPYFKSVFKNQDQTYLNNFKTYIEKQS